MYVAKTYPAALKAYLGTVDDARRSTLQQRMGAAMQAAAAAAQAGAGAGGRTQPGTKKLKMGQLKLGAFAKAARGAR